VVVVAVVALTRRLAPEVALALPGGQTSLAVPVAALARAAPAGPAVAVLNVPSPAQRVRSAREARAVTMPRAAVVVAAAITAAAAAAAGERLEVPAVAAVRAS
jgi:hypothetical protein